MNLPPARVQLLPARLSLTSRRIGLAVVLAAAAALLLGSGPASGLTGPTGGVARAVPGLSADGVASITPPAVVPAPPVADPAQPPPLSAAPSAPAVPPPSAGPPTRQPPAYTSSGAARRTRSDAVALTFDDGPDPVNTPLILDLLRQNGVKATFCLVGFRARDNPELVRRIAADGHTLCNHSWQHLFDLAKKPPEQIYKDLADTNAAIRAAVPDARIPYFRAPGGNFTRDLVTLATGMGMLSIYWEVDPRDWDHKPDATESAHVNRVVADVQRNTTPGSIVLSHDNKQPGTVEAYRTLLPWLKERYPLIALP